MFGDGNAMSKLWSIGMSLGQLENQEPFRCPQNVFSSRCVAALVCFSWKAFLDTAMVCCMAKLAW